MRKDEPILLLVAVAVCGLVCGCVEPRARYVDPGEIVSGAPDSPTMYDLETSVQTLMQKFIGAAVHPDRFYSKHLISRVSSQYDIDAPDLETRLMAIIDYISGMTDVYALDIYQKINGISLPIV